ncbi:MAG: sensor histidine kinase [Ilumatobacteraceae bacterium]
MADVRTDSARAFRSSPPHPLPAAARWISNHPRLVDAILAGLIACGAIGSLWNSHNSGTAGHPTWEFVVLAALSAVPLAWRRTWPLPTLLVLVAAQVVLQIKNADGPGWLAAVLAAYTFTTGNARVTVRWILVMGGGALALIVGLSIGFRGNLLKVLPGASFLTLVMIVGDRIRRGRELGREIAGRAHEQNRLDAERQLQDERSRIARELHDVVAHSMSVMIIQAAAARRQLASNPDRASEALLNIEETGRVAMHEMRRMLGVLRGGRSGQRGYSGLAGQHGADLAPQPSLEGLVELIASSADLPVHFDQPDASVIADLPQALGLSAYRVVQEALTNVRRHAGPVTSVDVALRRSSDALTVEVLDDGRGASAANAQPGFGLIGMRERVGMFAGQLTVGPRVGGGWRVRATFPLPAT